MTINYFWQQQWDTSLKTKIILPPNLFLVYYWASFRRHKEIWQQNGEKQARATSTHWVVGSEAAFAGPTDAGNPALVFKRRDALLMRPSPALSLEQQQRHYEYRRRLCLFPERIYHTVGPWLWNLHWITYAGFLLLVPLTWKQSKQTGKLSWKLFKQRKLQKFSNVLIYYK